jgi:peptide/nickel transport system substrate-binding protein
LAEELVARLTQATLVRLNRATGELEPRLARDWKPSPDGLTWMLALVEGVTFSDGTPFTSADVVFTFSGAVRPEGEERDRLEPDDQRQAHPGPRPRPRHRRDRPARSVRAGPVDAGFDSDSAAAQAAAALEAGTFREAWGTTTPVSEIVGLGPFVIQEYVPGQKLVFARNPKFWDMDDGRKLPYLDSIELQFVPDQNTEVLRLQAGQIDAISYSGAVRGSGRASGSGEGGQGRVARRR